MAVWDRTLELIRSRSREEWSALPLLAWARFRAWARDHGEQAALVGLLGGVAIVLFFKLFMFLLVISGILAFLIWELSVPESESKS